MPKNAYIHIPFCRSRCHYCSFTSFDSLEFKEPYLKALKQQIKAEYNGETLCTLYIGGGTPSLLSISELKNLLSLFSFEKNAEITAEVNPDSVDFKFLQGLRKMGVNRLSIGSQTFDDKILKLIGRRHSSKQIFDAVKTAQKVGFNNISLDFIYGLPTQTLSGFEADLKKAVELNIQHISLYGLKIEDGCYFYSNPPKSLHIDLDMQADMYLKAAELLVQNGFEHYEISNFALQGFNSRHNLNYWNENTYYGFGCAANGFVGNVRYECESDLEKYIKNPLSRDFEEELTNQELLEETIFLGLRKAEGINIDEINQKFGIDFNEKYKTILEKYNKYFFKTQDGYAFTTEGMLISNEILAEFIE